MRNFKLIVAFPLVVILVSLLAFYYVGESRKKDGNYRFINALNKKSNRDDLINWINRNIIYNPDLEEEVVHVMHLPIGDYIFREKFDCTSIPADLCVDYVVLIGEPNDPLAVGFLPGTGRTPIVYLVSGVTSVDSIVHNMGDSVRIEELAPRFYKFSWE